MGRAALALLRRLALGAAMAALGGLGQGARAERLVLSVSQPDVLITSSFSGARLVLFGVIDDAAGGGYDIAVTMRGPLEDFITWRKSRVLGIWVNTESRTFLSVPIYLSVATNRPAGEMASTEVLRREQIGLSRNIFVQRIGPDYADVVPDDPFRLAFLRIRKEEGLYREDPFGVTFVTPTVFRAELPIPGRAPIGHYGVTVKLLRRGALLAVQQADIEVHKGGFEQRMASFAQNQSLLYGLSVAFGSLMIGFVANILFRKE